MVTDPLEPLFQRMGIGGAITDVIAGFLERLSVTGTGVKHAQSATSMGEVNFQRFDGYPSDAPGFAAAMSFGMHVGKRGVAAVRRASRALMVG